ncbi:hypothetical protein FRD01_11635 [Microvenator marinus]|uniref:Uncharacterized protein n=1 Tax=Microvenator marinus TaxID=2600177 RepID=A0A5B8XQR5_9DELT|nr:hypothetical protein [Microvenator marinus]QED27875.1 hypothetical protein FRD01_11635 [Microvenator marinus]
MNAIEKLTPELNTQVLACCAGQNVVPTNVELLERVLVLSVSEQPSTSVLETLGRELKTLGFRWVAMDLEGL